MKYSCTYTPKRDVTASCKKTDEATFHKPATFRGHEWNFRQNPKNSSKTRGICVISLLQVKAPMMAQNPYLAYVLRRLPHFSGPSKKTTHYPSWSQSCICLHFFAFWKSTWYLQVPRLSKPATGTCGQSAAFHWKLSPAWKTYLDRVKGRCFWRFFVGPEKCVRPMCGRGLVVFCGSSA